MADWVKILLALAFVGFVLWLIFTDNAKTSKKSDRQKEFEKWKDLPSGVAETKANPDKDKNNPNAGEPVIFQSL